MQQFDHDGNRVPGIGQQLRRARDPGQVDHPFEIRRAAGAELPGEMLAADLEPAGEVAGAGAGPRGPLRCGGNSLAHLGAWRSNRFAPVSKDSRKKGTGAAVPLGKLKAGGGSSDREPTGRELMRRFSVTVSLGRCSSQRESSRLKSPTAAARRRSVRAITRLR